ncbi:hypothetical protein REPUB_Repub04eG0078800 [Reevesia pubescens]
MQLKILFRSILTVIRLNMSKRFFIFLFLLSLLLSSMLSATQARELRDSKLLFNNGSKKIHKGTFKGLFHVVKDSGPSPGVGHRYNNVQVEKSGPSPGEGHK